MKTKAFIFVVFCVIFSSYVNSELKDNFSLYDTGGKIINGISAGDGEYPNIVSLSIEKNDGLFMCGGSLIQNEWVLTAAHCIDGNVTSIKVTYNELVIPPLLTDNVYFATNMYLHQGYNPSDLSNDIGLIYVPNLFQATKSYLATPELTEQLAFNNQDVTVAGWGETETGSSSTILLKGVLRLLTFAECQALFGPIPDSHICAQIVNNQLSCFGDSGGPLYVNMGSKQIQLGLVSYGDEECVLSDIYTNTSKFTTSINDTIIENGGEPVDVIDVAGSGDSSKSGSFGLIELIIILSIFFIRRQLIIKS